VITHFKQLFTEEGSITSEFHTPTTGFPCLSPGLAQSLQQPFSTREVVLALKDMKPLKAPGPDGFHAFFYQTCWPVVGDEVCDVVLGVLLGNPLPPGLNDTYITLIPKVPNAERVTQFRPIGLCNVVYKLITKCIVNRLKKLLPDMISPVQSSFVPGRQITDNVIIMQEVLHSMRRKTGVMGWMAIKLDSEKAYDRLRWDFLRTTLFRMQLPDLLVQVIMQCVSTCSLNILWNGEPSGAFTPSRAYGKVIHFRHIYLWLAWSASHNLSKHTAQRANGMQSHCR